MKVLKEGLWKLPWSKEVVCSLKACGAVILVEERDLKPVDYSSKGEYFAECGVCGHPLVISPEDVPERLQERLDRKRKYSYCD